VTPVWHPSPNFSSRRGDARPSLVVLHYTGMATASAALARLCDPVAEVSAHYLIAETGVVTALVAEEMRAWHAGAGEWAGITDVNSHSIGIELANDGAEPFAHRQMQALEQMLRGIRARWKIAPNRIIGHSDMAPTRKRDPGPGSTGAGWHCKGCRSGRMRRKRPGKLQISPPTCSGSAIPTHRLRCCSKHSGCGSALRRLAHWTGPIWP